jgi:hypothetical protein
MDHPRCDRNSDDRRGVVLGEKLYKASRRGVLGAKASIGMAVIASDAEPGESRAFFVCRYADF